MELRIVMETVLAGTRRIAPVAGKLPVRAQFPASGYAVLPVWVNRA